MRLTLIQPCIGRRANERYMRTWQMEPLSAAVIAGLTPQDIELKFYDDRLEHIPFDESTDAVALSVETYTAKRTYQIASEYRKRGVPVIMGGFHASLYPEEVRQYADVTVMGEAEELWPEVIKDLRQGNVKRLYSQITRPSLYDIKYDRSIYNDKTYLPIRLVELGRGCSYKCDFCSIQSMFASTYQARSTEDVLGEISEISRDRKLIFSWMIILLWISTRRNHS